MPLSHSTLESLTKKLLLSIDSYNSTDLDIETPSDLTVATSGERARLAINFALHKIYDLIKDSKYMESLSPATISCVANQDFIDLDTLTEVDDIEAITDTTQDIKLTKKSWSWFRRNIPDPSAVTGTPYSYIRRNSRVWLTPRPTSAATYTIDFKKFTGDLTLKGDVSLLPTRYDYWIIAEAAVWWFKMEDPNSVPQIIIVDRDDARGGALDSILSSYDRDLQAGSNCEPRDFGTLPYADPSSD